VEQIGAQLDLTTPAVQAIPFRARGEYHQTAAR
jgi:hypothetical protein